MSRNKKVVRVVTDLEHEDEHFRISTTGLRTFLEQLRYAGLVRIHRDDNDGMCFDILPPHGVNEGVWAEQNAARMKSFGYNAVSAPPMP